MRSLIKQCSYSYSLQVKDTSSRNFGDWFHCSVYANLQKLFGNYYMWPGLRKQGMWAQTTPCLSIGNYLSIETEYFHSVTCIIMPNKFLLSIEIFIAIECWDKKLWVQKDWKIKQKSCAHICRPGHIYLITAWWLWKLCTQNTAD